MPVCTLDASDCVCDDASPMTTQVRIRCNTLTLSNMSEEKMTSTIYQREMESPLSILGLSGSSAEGACSV